MTSAPRQLALFGREAPPAVLAASRSDSPSGAAAVEALARRGIRLGAIGWAHPQWGDAVWSQSLDSAKLERDGLAEYSASPLFSTVCIELPLEIEERDLRRYAGQLEGMPAVVAAPASLTMPRFPRSAAYGARGGHANPGFLDPELFLQEVWRPVEAALGDEAALLLLSFPPALAAAGVSPQAFAERLERFLAGVPPRVVLAVEVREWRYASLGYARALAQYGASHVFGSGGDLPAFDEQARAVPTPPAIVVRLDDPVGAQYASDAHRRAAVLELLRAPLGRECWVLASDRAEGSAPRTLARLGEELAAAL